MIWNGQQFNWKNTTFPDLYTCEGKDNFYWNHKETNHTIVVKLE